MGNSSQHPGTYRVLDFFCPGPGILPLWLVREALQRQAAFQNQPVEGATVALMSGLMQLSSVSLDAVACGTDLPYHNVGLATRGFGFLQPPLAGLLSYN